MRWHHYFSPLNEVLERQEALEKKMDLVIQILEKIMSTIDDFETALASIDTQVAKISTDVDTLLAKLAAIPTGGLTPEQQAAIDAAVVHAQGIATSLGAIDTKVNPV